MQYAWLIWSIILLVVWAVVYLSLKSKESKKEMLVVSLWTSLLGLTEPLFVPEYWSPPSLFDLAQKTGFDFESLLFAFGVGGLAVVIYERIFHIKHERMSTEEKHEQRHKYHFLALFSAPIIFALLFIFTNLNPIYSTFIALIGGGLFTWYCRPDLKKKMFASAFIFSGLYFVYFLSLIAAYPGYIQQVWNLSAISGILVVGVPLEELMFAFGVGFLWSSVYEHIKWYRIKL
ncbi:MAG: lycopene cyclase domain-containing protein [bacterium]|nr:lycopene cyclase domain-containing protein [bacterium]